jgi:FKBP-type peptidyl-prolyl cis-trans isomerase
VRELVHVHVPASLTIALQRADGTQFDSTRDRAKPFSFVLGDEQVVPGVLCAGA